MTSPPSVSTLDSPEPAAPAEATPRGSGPSISDRYAGAPAWVWVSLMSVAMFAGHLLASLRQHSPNVYPDEAGYLATAQWLTGGTGFHMSFGELYHPGSSLVFAPAIAWFDTPRAQFAAAIVVNCALLALAFPLLLTLLRRTLDLTWGEAFLGAAVALCYPAFWLHAGSAWSEATLTVSFLLFALAIAWTFRSRGIPAAVATGVAACWCYAVHPRMVGVPFVWLIIATIAFATQRLPLRTWVSTGIATTVSFAIVRIALKAEHDALYAPFRRKGEGNSASRALKLSNIPDTFTHISGRYWYVVAASGGVAVIGLVYWVASVVPRRNETPPLVRARVGAYPILAISAMALAVLGMTTIVSGEPRADHLIYGRYIEPMLPIFLATGVVAVWRASRKHALIAYAVVALTFVLAGGVMKVGFSDNLFSRPMNKMMVTGVVPWVERANGLRVTWISFAVVLVLAGLCLARLGSRVLWVIALVALFAWATNDVYDKYVLPRVRALTVQGEQVAQLFSDLPGRQEVAVSGDTPSADEVFNAQWWNPQMKFHVFGRGVVERDETLPYVLGGPNFINVEPDARLVGPMQSTGNRLLWVIPSPEQDALEKQGRLYPAGFPAALPAAAQQAKITLRDHDVRGDKLHFTLELEHTGSESPWTIPSGAYGDNGAVAVVITAVDANGQGLAQITPRFPFSVAPGGTVTLRQQIGLPEGTTAASLLVQLAQIDFAEFTGPGSRATFPLG